MSVPKMEEGASCQSMIPISLPNDFGGDVSFTGCLVKESSRYDEGTGVLTKEALYLTDDGWVAYSIIRAKGNEKSRSAYMMDKNEDGFRFITDGSVCFPVDENLLVEMLFAALAAQAEIKPVNKNLAASNA